MDASDSSLLREFISGTGDQPFRQLVERYQDLVYSTALRRTGDRGRAEEVAQDVFVLLSKQARLLERHPNLAGWLYKTTLKKAANRMKSETRRRVREERFAEVARLAADHEAAPPAACALVDEALARLGDKEREALVLRFFQDLDLREVGEAQGASAEAARKRVNRALEELRGVFRRKGVAIPTAKGVAAVLAGSTQSAPAGFLAAASSAAVTPAVPSTTSVFLHYLLTMSKIHTAVCAAALVALPLVVQQLALANLAREEQQLRRQVASTPEPPRTAPSATLLPGAGGAPDESPEPGARRDLRAGLRAELDAAAKVELEIRQSQARAKAKELAAALGLDEARAAAIEKRALDNVAREQDRFLRMMEALGNAGSVDEVQAVAAASEEIPLFDGIEADLAPDQFDRYEEWASGEEETEMRNLAERQAYQDMAELQQVLNLDDEQRQKAFAILLRENVATFLGPDEQESAAAGKNPFEEQIRENLKERLRQFGEILTGDELGVYREHLESEWELDLD